MHAPPLARWLPLLLGVALLIGAPSASAATICVQDPACPAGADTRTTIADALALAADGSHPGPDRIQLGPATFPEIGLRALAGNVVQIVGAGTGKTVIAPPGADSKTTLELDDPASTVSDLTVRVAAGMGDVGLSLAGSAQRVAVTGSGGTGSIGVGLQLSGSFANGTVELPTTLGTVGVSSSTGSGAGTLEDSSVTAASGVSAILHVRRVRVTATATGIRDFSSGASTVDDALVRLVGSGAGSALTADGSSSGSGATLTARHVTLIGNGAPGSIGIASTSSPVFAPSSASVSVSGAILHGFGTDLYRVADGGLLLGALATANLAIDYSDYDPAKRVDTTTMGTGGATGATAEGTHSLNVDPGFRDAGGDFALRAGSPLVDVGDPAPPALGESLTDVAGSPRVVDGNGDGSAIADIGAFEYVIPPPPGPPPPPTRPTLGPLALTHARFAVGAGATARAATTTVPPSSAAAAAKRRRPKPAPRGTTIYFTLSRAASVTLTIQRSAAGRRSGKRCVKATRKLRKAKRCTRTVAVFTFTRHGTQGANAIAFSGRVGRRGRTPLAPGAYRLRITATADRLTSKARAARFTVVKR